MYKLIKKYLLSLYFAADGLLHTAKDKQEVGKTTDTSYYLLALC